jgi:type IV pilus assembly protein PilC
LGQILENVRERVKGGELLSDAFATHRMVPKIYTTTLMAGEKSGNIDEVLTRYINFQRLAMTFRKKLFVSLIYPTLLISVVTIMVLFLFTYVVPKFAELFNSLDAKLPAITLFMLGVGQISQRYFPFIAGGLALVGFVFWQWRKTDSGADQIDRVILSLPMLGDIRLKHQVATFSRMLATLLQGGLPLVPSMETAGSSMTSRRILKGIMRASIRVREGQGLAGSLEEQGIFPELAVEMLEVGESTGALPAMLNSVAEFYEEDVQTALNASLALIEPLILMVMAVFVGGVLISLYLPIFTLGVQH